MTPMTMKLFAKYKGWKFLLLTLLISAHYGCCLAQPYAAAVGNVTCISHDTKFTCNCQNVNQPLLLPNLDGSAFEVEVSNCKDLTIGATALAKTESLHRIIFKNIEKLVLQKDALSFSRYSSNLAVSLELEKVKIELIDSHAINGNVKSFSMIDGSIDNIYPFGFTTLQQEFTFHFKNVLIRKIQPQAFKKFTIEKMEISHCVFESNIPSKAFYDVEIGDYLRIDNSQFNEVHTRAFSFKKISKLIITDSNFNGVDAEWVEARVRDNVNIQSNNFGTTSSIAFKAIYVDADYVASEKLELRFHNNTVHFNASPAKALVFNERFLLSIKQLQYSNEYSCQDVDMEQNPPQSMQAFFRLHSDVIYFRKNLSSTDASNTFAPKYSYERLSQIIENDCCRQSYWLYIILGALGLLLVILIVGALVWMTVSGKRKLRKMVVMPEPRTYKETQIVYQIENAGLLKTDL